jgi:hypothetical protein
MIDAVKVADGAAVKSIASVEGDIGRLYDQAKGVVLVGQP